MKIWQRKNNWRTWLASPWAPVIGWLFLTLASAFLLYERYPFHFTEPNFYAEDGKVYAANVYLHGPLQSLLFAFNGYLILLQYVVVDGAMALNALVGHGLVTLPKAIAVTSYLSIGAACALPWLLFRRRLGTIWTLVLVLFLTFVPLGASDFGVIGTIGNLKFLCFYIAALLLIYRADKKLCPDSSYRMYLIDAVVLLCLLTNVVVAGLLPIALYHYRHEIWRFIKTRDIAKFPLTRGTLSLSVLCMLTAGYVLVIYMMGIPTIANYLDGPLQLPGLVNAVYRSSWYGFLYPLHTTLNIVIVSLLLLLTLGLFKFKRLREINGLVLWVILVGALGFVLNRPGVTEYLMGYTPDGGPGQFFYGCTMVFIFWGFYVTAQWFNTSRPTKKLLIGLFLALYLIWAIPHAGYRQKSYDMYRHMPTITESIAETCNRSWTTGIVMVPIYPLENWFMQLPKDKVCPP